MWRYQVIRPTVVPSRTILYLSSEQTGSRRHGLEALPAKGWFKSSKALSFKAGEMLSFNVLPKRLLKNLQAVGVDENSDPGLTSASAAAARAENRVLLTVPADLTFLEQIAWQTVQIEGKLTIKSFEKRCRGVSRWRLQRALRDMVDKQLFVREGATHHVCYHFGVENPCK